MDIEVLSGHPQLVKAALDAVQQWRYSPSKEVRVTIVTISFLLGRWARPHRPVRLRRTFRRLQPRSSSRSAPCGRSTRPRREQPAFRAT